MLRGLDSIRWYSEPWGEVESAEGGKDLGAWCLSTGDAGKDGPHLAMAEGSCGFSRAAAPVWGVS